VAYYGPRLLPVLKKGIIDKKRGFMDDRNENPSVPGKRIKK
jgi:hypothetical protein